MNDLERQFEILFVGRVTGDLILDPDKLNVEIGDRSVTIYDKVNSNKNFHIPTDSTPGSENDKVNSLIDLDSILSQFPKGSYSRVWGGGANNSAVIAAKYITTISPNLGVTLLTPNKQYLKIGSETFDCAEELDKTYNLNHHFLNFTPLNYSLIIGGDNKIIIRNFPRGKKDFKLNREHKAYIAACIIPNDGILINSLNDADMTAFIAKTVYEENQKYYNTQEALSHDSADNIADLVYSSSFLKRPKHRKLVTVVTPGLSRDEIVENIIPYSTLIMNESDLLKIFCGAEDEHKTRNNKETRMNQVLKTMAQMKFGMKLPRGIQRRTGKNNNIYVTLGSRGYLVALDNDVYHLRLEDGSLQKASQAIQENQGATTGLGDGLAAEVTTQETRGEARDYLKTAACVNTTVLKSLGMVESIHQSQIKIENKYDLKNYL